MRILKRVTIWIFSLSTALALVGYVLLHIYEEDIKKIALKEVNKSLAVEMKVDNYDVTVWETFPNLSLKFNNVVISESTPIANKPFAKAEELFLVFNILDIIKENYTISKIKAKNGEVNVYESIKGSNYLILKPSSDTASSAISLNGADFKNFQFIYNNDINLTHVDLLVNQIKFKGDFSSDVSNIKCKADGRSKYISLANKKYIKEKEYQLNSLFTFSDEELKFEETSLLLGSMGLNINGKIGLLENGNQYDLKFNADKSDLAEVNSLLPNEYLKTFNSYNPKGVYSINGKINGVSNKTKNPLVQIDFTVKDAKLTEPQTKESINNISFSGSYSNGKGKNLEDSDLRLIGIHAEIGGESLLAHFRINNFKTPFLNIELKGQTELKRWNGFIANKGIKLGGIATFDVKYFGGLNKMQEGFSAGQNSKGRILLDKVSIQSEANNFTNLHGYLLFNGNDIEFKRFAGNIEGNSFTSTGKIFDAMNYFLGNTKTLEVQSSIQFNYLDLNKFLNNSTNSSESSSSINHIPTFLTANSTILINELLYKKVLIKNLKGELTLNPGRLLLSNGSANLLDGSMTFIADLKNYDQNKLLGKLNFQANSLDIKKMFSQLDNFGQTTLTQDHLAGKVTSSIQMGAIFNGDLTLNEEMFYTHVNLKIEQGELKNFKPLEELSSYVDIKELKHIKFSTLENEFEIKEGKIILPKMKIENSALNLFIEGTHTFENYMNYSIQVKLAEVLSSKYGGILKSKNQSEDGTKIFISMKGTPDNLAFNVDKVGVKKVVKKTIKDEKKTVKDLIKHELLKKPKKDTAKKDVLQEEIKNTEWEE